MNAPDAFRGMSPLQARRAVAFDFEGTKGSAPVLVGELVDGAYHATFLDARFAPIARSLGLPLRTLPEWADRLVRLAEREDRLLLAYSAHELRVLERHVPHTQGDVAARYRNAQPLVRQLARDAGIRIPHGERSLKAFAEVLGPAYPPTLLEMTVPGRLRRILAALRALEDWDAAPAAARRELVDLLDYNRHDCLAMSTLVRQAVGDLPAPRLTLSA